MQASHIPAVAPAPSRFPWFLSLTLSIGVVLGTIGLGVYTFFLDRSIMQTQEETRVIEDQIAKSSSRRDIILTQILQNNAIRPSIDINGLITEFRNVAQKSNVRLTGFSVADDVISTSLIATAGNPTIHPDPASTVIQMMRDYAKPGQYFDLEPIVSLGGDSTARTTNIQLKVIGKKY